LVDEDVIACPPSFLSAPAVNEKKCRATLFAVYMITLENDFPQFWAGVLATLTGADLFVLVVLGNAQKVRESHASTY
jgi:hypothetical protein